MYPLRFAISLVFVSLLLLPVGGSLHARVSSQLQLMEDPETPAPPDMRVIVSETGQSYYTDEKGKVVADFPEPGFYTIRIIWPEGIMQIRRQIRYDGESFEIFRTPGSSSSNRTVNASEGISVIGLKDDRKLSRYSLTNEEIKRLPGAYGDSLKAIQTLPGISPAPAIGVMPGVNLFGAAGDSSFGLGPPYSNSSSGFLVLRGAGARAGLFYLDGFKIQYPYHLGDQSSVVANNFIGSVDVYTGTFPARYGSSTAGVISIESPEVKDEGGSVNTALFLSGGTGDIPFDDGNGSVQVAAKKSYPNYTLLKLYPDAIPDNAKYAAYEDGQFIFKYKPHPNHALTFLAMGAKDKLEYTKSVADAQGSNSNQETALAGSTNGSFDTNDSDSRPPVGLNRSFETEGFRYLFATPWIRNELTLQVSQYREDFELDFRSPFTGESIFRFRVLDVRRELQAKDEVTIPLYKEYLVARVGAESNLNRWELSMANLSQRKTVNPNTPDFVETINELIDQDRRFRAMYDGDRTRYTQNAAWTELETRVENFYLVTGVRVDSYSLSGSTGVGPRIAAEYRFEETGTTLLAGAGRHYNAPLYQDQISEEAGNPWLEMEEADHMSAGISQKLPGGFELKAEAYRNIYSNLVVSDSYESRPYSIRQNRRDMAEIPDELLADPLETRPLYYSNDGTGESKGFEFFLRKSPTEGDPRWYGWISYTLSWTKRNNHQTRLTDEEKSDLSTANLNRTMMASFHSKYGDFHYYDTNEWIFLPDNDREELYDLDRTHQVTIVLGWKITPEWTVGSRFRYATGTPYTPIVSASTPDGLDLLGRATFIPEYSEYYNSRRYPDFHQMDIRIDRNLLYEWGAVSVYVEFINVYARRNVESENFSFLYPVTDGSNPSYSYESTYVETPIGGGRRLRLPLVNAGMEVQF